MEHADDPLFSIIMPTRNRAELFMVALDSALQQRLQDFEVIVVNDGSREEQAARYHESIAGSLEQVPLFTLEQTDRGHSQSFALNFGVSQANGRYVGFLDDDNQWVDPTHLAGGARLVDADPHIDVVLGNQRAFRNGVRVGGTVWIEGLSSGLTIPPDACGAYSGHPHRPAVLQGTLPPEYGAHPARSL